MKKRNILAIVASVAAVLTMFTACGDKGDDTKPTVIGEDGQVYEEVTEVVTDAEGNTTVVTVTKPVESETSAGTTTPGAEATTTYEDVTFPEGEKVEVEVNKDGRPADCKIDKILKASAKDKSFYLNCIMVTDTNLGLAETGINLKIYMKGTKYAVEMPMGLATMRMAYDGKSLHVMFPKTKSYYSMVADASDNATMEGIMELWNSIGSDTMQYVETTKVKIKGTEYTCEVFDDSTNINKYYFNSNDELKRMEIIAEDGTTSIIKVNECSTKVDDSVFSIPAGYTQLSEDALRGMVGSMGF